MKKFFLMMTAALALSLVSCNGNKDYKAEGQELSKQLDEVVEKNDTAAALTTDESIREMEQEIVALGDSAALADFRAAIFATEWIRTRRSMNWFRMLWTRISMSMPSRLLSMQFWLPR